MSNRARYPTAPASPCDPPIAEVHSVYDKSHILRFSADEDECPSVADSAGSAQPCRRSPAGRRSRPHRRRGLGPWPHPARRHQAALALGGRQGWLRRVGPGTYALAQLDSIDSEQVLDDPWILVPALYAPAYIGGWTAAEHWDLTEQLFRSIVVMTTRSIHAKHVTHHGTPFLFFFFPFFFFFFFFFFLFFLRHIQLRKLFGTPTRVA